jgi:putative peptidoglycan lipid II flippase
VSRIYRAAGIVSVATLVSRVLGLLRDTVRAVLFGAEKVSDALEVAFRIPNLFRDLFAEGAFTGAFVPTISAARARGGDGDAFTVLNRVLSTMLLYVGAIVAAIVLAAPWIVRVVTAPGFADDPADFAHTVLLVRVLAPFLLFICLAVAAMGTLNVFERFFVPALSPATQNLVLVAGGVVLDRFAQTGPEETALRWAYLLLAGGAVQFVIQVPPPCRQLPNHRSRPARRRPQTPTPAASSPRRCRSRCRWCCRTSAPLPSTPPTS